MFLSNSDVTEIKNIIKRIGGRYNNTNNKDLIIFKTLDELNKKIEKLQKEVKDLKSENQDLKSNTVKIK